MKLLILMGALFFTTSIYNLSYTTIDGATQSMNAYQGKKILLVNIATNSAKVGQLAQLQQLQQLFPDSLVVIGFPDNSFGFESRTNAQIKTFCEQNYGVTFKLAAKNNVTGSGIQPIYNWLTTKTENGMMGEPVKADFQKYLINEQGMLIGVFSASTLPLSATIVDAVRN
jgi:glutathione peroxidase